MPRPRIADLGGQTIAYDADHDETLEQLGWFFGGHADGEVPPELVVHVGGSVAVDPESASPDRVDGPIDQWHEAGRLVLRHELGPRARVTDTTFEITSVAAIDDGWRALRQLLFSGLAWWLERRDIVLVHGAMIARGPDAVLVLGETGDGKSTTALAALRAGWELCSDDLVLARVDAPSVSVFGLPKRVSADADLVRFLGLPFDEMPHDERGRVMLRDSALGRGWRRLSLVVVVGHHDGPGVVEPIGHSDALAAVLRSYLESERPDAVRRQLACLSAMAGSPAFLLLHAVEPGDRLARAAELLEEAWHHATVGSGQVGSGQ